MVTGCTVCPTLAHLCKYILYTQRHPHRQPHIHPLAHLADTLQVLHPPLDHLLSALRLHVERVRQLHSAPARVLGHLVGVRHALTLLQKLVLVGLLEVLYNLLAFVNLV